MPWTCPECKRVFARNKQAHSCQSYNLNPLFAKSNSEVRDLYDKLILLLEKFGPIDIRVSQYHISIRNLSTFLNIVPEKTHLTLSFVRDEALDEFPIYNNYQRSKNRWSNSIKIESEEEIDEQLINWLNDAYKITGESK